MPERSVVRTVWWWILDYAYALYWQARSIGSTHEAALLTGTARPIVVVPGIWESWGFLRPLITPVHNAGHPVHVLTTLRRNGRPVTETAQDVATYLAEPDLRDVVIVAHSKGGLIGKSVMADSDPEGRITAMVAIATPFGGSRYASYLPLPSLRAFSPRDATTRLLMTNVIVNTRIVSVYGVFDPHIPDGSELAGARNIRLPTGGHFRILADRATIAQVLDTAAQER